MSKIRFKVQNAISKPTREEVQVFLRPTRIPPAAEFFAWQSLRPPSGGGVQIFEYRGGLEVQAIEDKLGGSRSRIEYAAPGEHFQAVRERNHGPQLERVPGDPEHPGAVVENRTDGPLRIRWYSGFSAIMEEPLASGQRASFEMVSNLLIFRVAPSSDRERFTPSELDDPASSYFVDPHRTQQVSVIWKDAADGGSGSDLIFAPESADPVPAAAAKRPSKAGPAEKTATGAVAPSKKGPRSDRSKASPKRKSASRSEPKAKTAARKAPKRTRSAHQAQKPGTQTQS